MITNPKEYLELLYLIQDRNNLITTINRIPPMPMPSTETILKVDLNKRTVEAPAFLSLEKDHRAETIFFEVDRYFGSVDLAQTTCIIQYQNNKKESRIYPVPYYDTVSRNFIYTDISKEEFDKQEQIYYTYQISGGFLKAEEYNEEENYYIKSEQSEKIYIPWQIGSDATIEKGTVIFNLRFYIINFDDDKEEYFLTYNLSTKPTTSKILESFVGNTQEIENAFIDYGEGQVLQILQELALLKEQYKLKWLEMK